MFFEYIDNVYATQPDLLEVTLATNDVSCFNGNDGMAIANLVTGGTYPYFYVWNTNEYTPTIGGLIAGNYQVTVRDANSCEAYANIDVDQPNVLQVYLTSTPAECGVTGGAAYVSSIGGTAPYDFAWSNGQPGNGIIDVDPGTYSVTVTDENSCSASQEILVNISGNINADISVIQEISCPGDTDGMIEASSSNGELPIEYNWTSGEVNPVLTNVGPGTYLVIVSDAWGCTGSANQVLMSPESVVLSSSITNNICYNGNTGVIALTINGGYPPYITSWSNAISNDTITNLIAADYTVTVTDSHACSTMETYTVVQPDELILQYQVNNISCYGDLDGAVAMTGIGGTMPYSFSFFTGEDYIEGATHAGIPAGAYSLHIDDNNGCQNMANIMILEPADLSANYTAYDPSCIGNSDGYIEIIVQGGTAPYLFGWNENYIDIPIISGLTQGDYEVQITDSNNCIYSFSTIYLTDTDVDCISIPNAFTPNNDGVNDTWIIENLDIFPGAHTYVYNRWGQEIWVGNPSDEWDGQYRGKFVPTGTYLFVINLFDGTPPYKGTVTIIY